jgi:hypothetical protein
MKYPCYCGLTESSFEACPYCEGELPINDASHLIQSASDTAMTLTPEDLDEWLKHETTEIGAYWKSKEGKCLACGLDIAVQDSYCPSCTSFLEEVHTQSQTH